MRRGLVCVLKDGRHDVSETHDNFLRDLLRAFLSSPHECHRIVEQWKPCPYLSSIVSVVEVDQKADGVRMLCYVDNVEQPKKNYGRELLDRMLKYKPLEAKEDRLRDAAGGLASLGRSPRGGTSPSAPLTRGALHFASGHQAASPSSSTSRRCLSPSTPRAGPAHGGGLAAVSGLSATAVAAARGRSAGRGPLSPVGAWTANSVSGEFKVQLRKGPQGLGFSIQDNQWWPGLIVEWVEPSGALAAWNSRNPSQALCENDIICAVNGVSNSPDAMCDMLAASQWVELICRSGRGGPGGMHYR